MEGRGTSPSHGVCPAYLLLNTHGIFSDFTVHTHHLQILCKCGVMPQGWDGTHQLHFSEAATNCCCSPWDHTLNSRYALGILYSSLNGHRHFHIYFPYSINTPSMVGYILLSPSQPRDPLESPCPSLVLSFSFCLFQSLSGYKPLQV